MFACNACSGDGNAGAWRVGRLTKYELKPLGVGAILDQTIQILRDQFGLFLKILLCLQLPLALGMNILFQQRIAPPHPGASPEEVAAFVQTQFVSFFFVTMPLLVVISIFVVPFMNAAVVDAASCVYRQKPAGVVRSLRAAMSRYFPLVGASFLVFFFTFLGSMLCLLPGILMAFWFALATQTVVLEGRSGM